MRFKVIQESFELMQPSLHSKLFQIAFYLGTKKS